MFMKECKTIQKVIFILAVICVSITQSWADSWKEIFFADPLSLWRTESIISQVHAIGNRRVLLSSNRPT